MFLGGHSGKSTFSPTLFDLSFINHKRSRLDKNYGRDTGRYCQKQVLNLKNKDRS
jgi:hypothetical protein